MNSDALPQLKQWASVKTRPPVVFGQRFSSYRGLKGMSSAMVTRKPNLHNAILALRCAPQTRLQETDNLGSFLIRVIPHWYQRGCFLRFIPDVLILTYSGLTQTKKSELLQLQISLYLRAGERRSLETAGIFSPLQ